MKQTDKLNFKLDLQMFAEEEPEPPKPEEDYLKVIKDLKEKSVSKEEYDKLLEDRNKLLNDYLNGGDLKPHVDPKNKESAEDIREYLRQGKARTNLELWTKYLDLRDKVMEQGEIDPMVPVGPDVTPKDSDFASAAKTASEIRECIENCGGDPELFNQLLDKKFIGGFPKHNSRK